MVTSYTKPTKSAQGGQGLKSSAAAATQAARVSANQAAFRNYQQASAGDQSRNRSQKEIATNQGGVFEENGSIYQVSGPSPGYEQYNATRDRRTNEERLAQLDQLSKQAKKANIPREVVQKSESNFSYDEGGTVTVREKKYFSRESRQEVKDFIRNNPADSYQILDEQGRLIKTVPKGRLVYPEILKATLKGPVSIRPISKLGPGERQIVLGTGVVTVSGLKQDQGFIGPPTKAEAFIGPPTPARRDVTGAFLEAGELYTRPFRNLGEEIGSFVTGKPSGAKPTPADQLFQATEKTLLPGARDLFAGDYGIGKIRQATPQEKQDVTNAFPQFIEQTQRQIQKDSKQFVIPLLGDISFFATPLPIGRAATYVGAKVAENKIVNQAIKDFQKVLAPKQLGLLKAPEGIPLKITTTPETITLYHGTTTKASKVIKETGLDEEFTSQRTKELFEQGKGVWATTNKDIAQDYANLKAKQTGSPTEIIEVNVRKDAFDSNLDFTKYESPIGEIKPKDIVSIVTSSGTYKNPIYTLGDPRKLTKVLGGEILIPSRVGVSTFGPNFVRLESQSVKQNQLILYNPEAKRALVLGKLQKGELPEAFNVRGPLSDVLDQQIAQQQKFGLTQEAVDFFKTTGKITSESDIVKALQSESITQIGSVKTFSLEQIQKDPKAFGRYLFGNEPPPVSPLSNIGLLETTGYRTGGTKIRTNKIKEFLSSDVFKPYREKTIKLRIGLTDVPGLKLFKTEKHFSKIPSSSYVIDVKKNIKFVDPFSGKVGKGKALKIDSSKLGVPLEGEGAYKGKNPTGKTFTELISESKETRNIVSKEIQKEIDILFSKPRFPGYYGAPVVGLTGTKIDTGVIYQNPNVPPSLRLIESPQSGEFTEPDIKNYIDDVTKIKPRKKDTTISELTKDIEQATKPSKQDEGGLIKTLTKPSTGVTAIPDFVFDITPITTPITTPILIPKTTPKLVPELTPELTTELTPDFTPEIFPEETPFPKGGGLPPWLPKGYFGSGGYGEKGRSRRIYEAFGISEDINIKYIERVLPKTPIIRTSYSPGRIYQQLSKEDKKAMDLFYGKKTRKSYKSKGRKRKR